jgi:methionyl-tRNA formyltransferase
MANSKMKIIFIKSSEFGAIILEKLIQARYEPILVISTPIKEKIFQINPDLIIAPDFHQPISKEILDIPKQGLIGVHPSLLPRWRGSFPIQSTILNEDKKTGVTIFLMDEKIDHGQVLAQRELLILEDENSRTLHDKLANLGAHLLMEIIPKWQRGLIKPQPQDETKVTFSKILTREDGKINWRKTAEELEREIRAFNFWPGSYTIWQKGSEFLKIEILKARVLKTMGGLAYPIGKILVAPQNEICIQCGKGFLPGKRDFLVIEKLKLEGEKEMSSEEFIRSYRDFIGNILK